MRSLGADHVIDYEQTDFTATGERYDLILDLIAHGSVLAYARALRPNGTYLMVGGSLRVALLMFTLAPWMRRTKRRHFHMLMVPQNRDDLNTITRLCEAGKVTPAIDRRFTLDEAREALRYVVDGHARGKVVITCGSA
jgi:NADPH:quinone reductase-like Zn-dependent oxidoreductase